MKTRIASRAWIPFWGDKWLFGSMRIEFNAAERGIWWDLMAMAMKDNGYIRANEDFAYPIEQLSGLLIVPQDELQKAIDKFVDHGKLTRKDGGILYVTNWEKYAFTDRHMRRVEKENEEMSDKLDAMSGKEDTNGKVADTRLDKNRKDKNRKDKSLGKDPNEVDIKLTQLLIDLMLENDPKSHIVQRLTDKRQEEWINQCRLLREEDGRTEEEIEMIIRWCQKDDFWKANILSMSKLRKQFSQLWLKAKKSNFSGIQDWLRERRQKRERK